MFVRATSLGGVESLIEHRASVEGPHSAVPQNLLRISIGIAWLVIVAAEMLVGGTGIGYFVWNEWNNLSIANIVTAILLIGLVGLLLDQGLAWLAKLVTYPE